MSKNSIIDAQEEYRRQLRRFSKMGMRSIKKVLYKDINKIKKFCEEERDKSQFIPMPKWFKP